MLIIYGLNYSLSGKSTKEEASSVTLLQFDNGHYNFVGTMNISKMYTGWVYEMSVKITSACRIHR